MFILNRDFFLKKLTVVNVSKFLSNKLTNKMQWVDNMYNGNMFMDWVIITLPNLVISQISQPDKAIFMREHFNRICHQLEEIHSFCDWDDRWRSYPEIKLCRHLFLTDNPVYNSRRNSLHSFYSYIRFPFFYAETLLGVLSLYWLK